MEDPGSTKYSTPTPLLQDELHQQAQTYLPESQQKSKTELLKLLNTNQWCKKEINYYIRLFIKFI